MKCVHVVHIQLHVSCTHNCMAQKLFNTKFVVVNMTKIVANDNQSCKLHNDQLQMIRFIVGKNLPPTNLLEFFYGVHHHKASPCNAFECQLPLWANHERTFHGWTYLPQTFLRAFHGWEDFIHDHYHLWIDAIHYKPWEKNWATMFTHY